MTTIIYYSPIADDSAHRYKVTMTGDYDLGDDSDDIAEHCAEDWHNNYDGWEGSWPRVFALYRDKTGPAFGRFEVDVETVPNFTASPA